MIGSPDYQGVFLLFYSYFIYLVYTTAEREVSI